MTAGPRFLVCHADGASRGNPGPAAAGVVVLDPSGSTRRSLGVPLGEATNNAAEYMALLEALRAAGEVCREDGVDPSSVRLIVKTDSQLVARQVSGEYRVKSPDLAPLLARFHREARAFAGVEVRHVGREESAVADRLANETLDGLARCRTGTARPAAAARPTGARPWSRLTHLECARCGGEHPRDGAPGVCRSCGGPLLARYDLAGLRWPPEGPPGLWRYHELLPVLDPGRAVSLGEGGTPLVPLHSFERELGLAHVLLKDEGRNPTGTFKARGAAVAVSRLAEFGLTRLAIPTAGNAGAAFAAYAARAGLDLLVAMPEDAPASVREETAAYGAEVRLVPGLLPDAGRYVRERAAAEGRFVAATFEEPWRVEGKKTIALEIFETLGSRWPDAIVFPVGGGVGLVAAWKAASELARAGVAGRPPRLFAVQAEGCAPVVKAFAEGRDETEPFANAATVAAGLRVPSPRAGFLILRALRASGGAAVAVPDELILRTVIELRRKEGINLCPEGAAGVAALSELVRHGWLDGCREVVVVNTGTGLKYPL
ncbi:MAG: threonine synthase [Firmicutes bacterium]|nr:threonine synthase [Bacillota bacterium]